jgi:hypothetical protein
MSNKFLRFDSQEQYEGLKQFFTEEHAIDEVGTIESPAGWHVNFQGPIPQELVGYLVFPVQPKREFFGVPNCKTVTYLGEINSEICVEIEGVVYAFN